jgi:hypothetical protein
LLGISTKKYPKKKIPAANPNCWLLIASSRFIVSAANPKLILSMNATTYSANRNGSSLILSFRIVAASIRFETMLGFLTIPFLHNTCQQLQLNCDCRHDNGLRLTKTLTGN